MNEKLYTVGEMAKLSDINTKTLRYYDDIGLLKPTSINPQTGYRYYSEQQLLILHNIRCFRTMGISINKIKQHLQLKNLDAIKGMLEEQRMISEEKIREFENIKALLENSLKYVNLLINKELKPGVIKEIHHEARHAFIMEADTTAEQYYIGLHEKLCREAGANFYEWGWGQVGRGMSMDTKVNKNYQMYSNIFIFIDKLSDKMAKSKYYSLVPAGTYLSIFVDKSFHQSDEFYRQLERYCLEHDYEPDGIAYEIALAGPELVKDETKYISEIQLRVKPRKKPR